MAQRFNQYTNQFYDINYQDEEECGDENRYQFDDSLEMPTDNNGHDENNDTTTLVSSAANVTATSATVNKNMNVRHFNNNYHRDYILTSNNKFFNNNVTFAGDNFVSIKDDDDEPVDEIDSGNYMDENVDSISIHYRGENDTGFKLPPRLAARLFKKAVTKPNSQKLLQNLENIPLPRRETIVVRSKKSKTQPCQNGQANNEKSNANEQSAFVKETEDCRYVSWINSVIATSFKIENLNVDMTRIINDCMISEQSSSTKNKNVNNAGTRAPQIPLKDGISSIAYKEIKMMDKLRVKAVNLYESDQLKLVKEVLMEDLKIGRFYIRKDKSIHADVGAKKHILEIFLNYNPLWLKIAIETVFGIKIGKSTKNEVHTLIQSLTHNLLSFKEKSLKKNCKSLTTYFMNENNVNWAKLHILYHFLILVHFLEVAKRNRLIDHDPCLFRTDAACKTSRDIIISFSRDYITGVGDIIKSLRNVGIHLEHEQNPIEEFNFTVTNLGVDLRCGVRLARMAEILLLRNDILSKLYYPPNSITRKMHNMDIVFSVLKQALIELPKTIVPKDICNGYRQKTLIFLDKLIGFYKIRIREIELQQSIDSIIKIQRTFRRYLQCKQDRQNFLQLKSFTIVVQRLFRSKLNCMLIRNEFLQLKSSALCIQRRFRANQLMIKERQNYLKICFSVIVFQKAYRSHKLLQNDKANYQNLRKTTIFVQRRFRLNQLLKVDRSNYLIKRDSAIKIQRFYRTFCQRRRFLQLKKVTLFSQNKFRANRISKIVHENYLKQKQSAITIQRYWRACLRKKQLTNAAIIVQRRFRARLMMINQRSQYLKMRKSAIVIQRIYRGHLLTLQERDRFVQLKRSAIVFQKNWRAVQQRRKYLRLQSCSIKIQNAFRSFKIMRYQREYFISLRKTVVFIQRKFRQNQQYKIDRLRYTQLQSSAIVFQKNWRAVQQRRKYLNLRKNTIIIQQAFRSLTIAREQQKYYLTLRKTAIFIQKRYRQNKQYKIDRFRYTQLQSSAIVFQKNWKAIQQRRQYLNLRKNTIIIQQAFRSLTIAQEQHKYYLTLRKTAIFIQKRFLQNKQYKMDHNRFLLMKQSAITIQRFYKTRLQRKQFLQLRQCTIYVQIKYRANCLAKIERSRFLQQKHAAILIQKNWRLYLRQQELIKAALAVQRRFRANLEMRKCRTRYLKMKQIVSVIQQRYRAKVVGRKQRQEYLQLRQQVIIVQRLYRDNKRGNHFKSVVIQYWHLNNLAATMIQRLWRGYSVRKQLHREMPRLAEINQNLEIIAEDITEDKILFNIINKILERISRIQSINHLHHDVEKLEFGTSNSIEVCQTITNNDWILTTLIYSFKSLNRSEPHKKIIQNILAIFLNILYKTDCQVLYCNAELFEVLLRIVRNFPKADSLLCQTCLILVHLFSNSETLKMFKKDLHLIQALQSFIKKNLPPRNPINRSVSRQSVVSYRSTASFTNNINSLPCLASKLSTLINN